MFYISISITLLALVATLYVWSKTHQAQPNGLFKWMIYAVLLISSLLLICQLSRGVMRMTCQKDKCNKEMQCGESMECRNHEYMQSRHADKCMMDRGGMKKECDETEDDDDNHSSDSTKHHAE